MISVNAWSSFSLTIRASSLNAFRSGSMNGSRAVNAFRSVSPRIPAIVSRSGLRPSSAPPTSSPKMSASFRNAGVSLSKMGTSASNALPRTLNTISDSLVRAGMKDTSASPNPLNRSEMGPPKTDMASRPAPNRSVNTSRSVEVTFASPSSASNRVPLLTASWIMSSKPWVKVLKTSASLPNDSDPALARVSRVRVNDSTPGDPHDTRGNLRALLHEIVVELLYLAQAHAQRNPIGETRVYRQSPSAN